MKKFALLLLTTLLASSLSSYAEIIWTEDNVPFSVRLFAYEDYPQYNRAEIVKADHEGEHDWLMGYYYGVDLVIPSSVEYNGVTYPVTTIGRDAFNGGQMKSVEVPTSITSIYGNPFQNCPNLREFRGETATHNGLFLTVVFQEYGYSYSTTMIAAFANAGAPDNYDLVLDSSLAIGEDAFRNATKLKSITFDGDIRLRNNCFRGCSNLKEIKEYSSFFTAHAVFRDSYYDENDDYITGSGFFKECPNIEYFHLYDDYNLMFGNLSLPNDTDMDHVPVLIASQDCFDGISSDDFWKNAPSMLKVNIPEEISIDMDDEYAEKTATIFANVEKGSENFEMAWNFPETDVISVEDTETAGEKKLTALKAGTVDFSLTFRQKTSPSGISVRKAPSQYSTLTFPSKMTAKSTTGIDAINADSDAEAVYYNLNGVQVAGDDLTPGFYIVKSAKSAKKVLIK
ncbi:MAG: leucine-rich repeat protein [Muribaculaceae bacterium]|nr:leucine-rich repeat protein [Muribaculaceae bacterium]